MLLVKSSGLAQKTLATVYVRKGHLMSIRYVMVEEKEHCSTIVRGHRIASLGVVMYMYAPPIW